MGGVEGGGRGYRCAEGRGGAMGGQGRGGVELCWSTGVCDPWNGLGLRSLDSSLTLTDLIHNPNLKMNPNPDFDPVVALPGF